jgi:hypothetical protein
LTVDHSKAPQATTALPGPVALATTHDLEEVDRDQPLAAFGPGGKGRVAWRETRDVAGQFPVTNSSEGRAKPQA